MKEVYDVVKAFHDASGHKAELNSHIHLSDYIGNITREVVKVYCDLFALPRSKSSRRTKGPSSQSLHDVSVIASNSTSLT